jgi:acyl-coenzyme A thioesterase PaaI-like protein
MIICQQGKITSARRPDNMNTEELKTALTDTIPWVKQSGLKVDIFEKGHILLSVPVNPQHINHVGIVYAGTYFMLMEVAGAALFLATYGAESYIPINRAMNIRFIKPSSTDIFCELFLTQEKADEMIAPVKERGKGDWILDMTTSDSSGKTVSESTCTYYIIPVPKA